MTYERRQIEARIHQWLDEADQLDRLADKYEHEPKPAPVCDVAAMDLDWIAGTLGPARCRVLAQQHRARAAVLTKTLPTPKRKKKP